MLKLVRGIEVGRPTDAKMWMITSEDLLKAGIKSIQGFTLQLRTKERGAYFWTTNIFNAFLFFKRTGLATKQVHQDFEDQKKLEYYLYNLSYSTDSDIELNEPTLLKYRPHQKSGIEYCLRTKNTLIADQQRIGKTAIALGTINNLENVQKVLILCPKTAKSGWLQECNDWLIKSYKIQVLDAKSEIEESANIYIANYDLLPLKPGLSKIHWDVLITDEIHMVSRPDTQRSRFFGELKATKIIALSGTPLLNQAIDFLSVLQLLDPFWNKFFVRKDKFISLNGITLSLDEVQEIARSSVMVRRTQAQIFKNEPIETRIVTLPVSDKIKPLVEAELQKLEDYTKVRRLLGLSKVNYALNHLNVYASSTEKIVAFTFHHEVLERLASSLGIRAACIYGESSDKERSDAKTRFNTDPNCHILLGSIGAASMALNLSVSQHIVFIEQAWENWLVNQAMERCSDQLQTEQVVVEFLAYEGSLDHKMFNKVYGKDARCAKALDMVV